MCIRDREYSLMRFNPIPTFSNCIFNADAVAVLPDPLLSEIIAITDMFEVNPYTNEIRL